MPDRDDPKSVTRADPASPPDRRTTADKPRGTGTHDPGGVARDGGSRSADAGMVGVNRKGRDRYAESSNPQQDAPMKQQNERDASASDMTDAADIPDQTMRRAGAGAPAVVGQAHKDIERGLIDTDMYGSGNLGSVEDKGRRPDAPVERADDAVRRSGHDVDKPA